MNKDGKPDDEKMADLLKAMGGPGVGSSPGAEGSETEDFSEVFKKLMNDEMPGVDGLDDLLKASGTPDSDIEKLKEEYVCLFITHQI